MAEASRTVGLPFEHAPHSHLTRTTPQHTRSRSSHRLILPFQNTIEACVNTIASDAARGAKVRHNAAGMHSTSVRLAHPHAIPVPPRGQNRPIPKCTLSAVMRRTPCTRVPPTAISNSRFPSTTPPTSKVRPGTRASQICLALCTMVHSQPRINAAALPLALHHRPPSPLPRLARCHTVVCVQLVVQSLHQQAAL